MAVRKTDSLPILDINYQIYNLVLIRKMDNCLPAKCIILI